MSEADSHNDQLASASTEPSEPGAAVDPADAEKFTPAQDDGWQTVDFPGAMSVEDLPHSHLSPSQTPPDQVDAPGRSIESGVIRYGTAEIDPSTAYIAAIALEPDAVSQLQQLQNENAILREQLVQVELNLVQHQIERQLESACFSPAETASEAVLPQSTLQPTHDRLHQLLHELERSHQTAQRQQILVETLTEQLESSQERIAQLERDCALTQQRHNEQVQQVLQAENACRDLRLRLHRQQQQTLQFKAALEKCLEMPAVYGQAMPDVVLDGTAAPNVAALLKSKNQPVKPWSLPLQATQASASDQVELPKPLFKLLNQGASEQGDETDLLPENSALTVEVNSPFGEGNHAIGTVIPAVSTLLNSDEPQLVTHLMQLIFPDTAECQAYTTTDALQTDVSQVGEFFALSPSPKETVINDTIPSVEMPEQAPVSLDRSTNSLTPLENIEIHHQVPFDAMPSDAGAIVDGSAALPHDHSNDPLYSVGDTSPDAPAEPIQTTSGTTAIPPLFTVPPLFSVPHEAAPAAEASGLNAPINETTPLTAWTWRDRLVSKNTPQAPMPGAVTGTPQSPSKLLALSAGSQQLVPQTVSSSQPEPVSPSFATAAPSPIVYPLRSTKKLASIAAVDLPTFPRRWEASIELRLH